MTISTGVPFITTRLPAITSLSTIWGLQTTGSTIHVSILCYCLFADTSFQSGLKQNGCPMGQQTFLGQISLELWRWPFLAQIASLRSFWNVVKHVCPDGTQNWSVLTFWPKISCEVREIWPSRKEGKIVILQTRRIIPNMGKGTKNCARKWCHKSSHFLNYIIGLMKIPFECYCRKWCHITLQDFWGAISWRLMEALGLWLFWPNPRVIFRN